MNSISGWLNDVAAKVPSVSTLPSTIGNPFTNKDITPTTNNAANSSVAANETGYAEWERLLRGGKPDSNAGNIELSSVSAASGSPSSPSSSSTSSAASSSSSSPTSSSLSSYFPCYGWLNGLLTNLEEQLSLSWQQRMVGFIMFLIAGLIMLGFSFLYLSGVFLGASAKFAMAYGLANIFLLTASCLFVGPSKQLATMFNSDRWIISLVYVCSLFLTLFCAWQIRSFYVMLPMLVVQFGSLLFYIASFVPFGKTAMTRMTTWMAGRFFSSSSSLLPI